MPWTLVAVLIISLPLTAINYYVGRTIFRALTQLTSWNRARLKWWTIGIHSYLNLLPIVFFLAFLIAGRGAVAAFAGDSFIIDLILSYPFWISLIVMVQLLALFALLQIVGFLILRLVRPLCEWWQRARPILVIGLTIFVTIYTLLVVIRDTWTVRIVRHEINLPKGLECLSGFRIAEISDVQGDGRTTYDALRNYVSKVNALEPDIVLFGGDLVSSGTRYIDSTAHIMGGFRSRFGTVAAIGDHDIFTNKAMVLAALKRERILVVEDSTLFFPVDSCRIVVSVVTYTYLEKPTRDQFGRFEGAGSGEFRILLVHQPAEKLVDFARNKGYQLMLTGHTHGGGVAFGIPGLFLWAPANLESPYVSGLYHLGGLELSVTNGLGLTLAPVRFHAPAEIVLITLK
jgi:predicted MPP superfamily phosphohydrolase